MKLLAIIAEAVEGEIWLNARQSAYAQLAEDIEAGWRGSRSLSANPAATGTPLLALEVVETSVPRVTFRVVGAALVLAGSQSALGLLSRNLKGLGVVVQAGTHTHWEHFPGVERQLFDVHSTPVVAEVLPD